jgi:hypothetical protein
VGVEKQDVREDVDCAVTGENRQLLSFISGQLQACHFHLMLTIQVRGGMPLLDRALI